MALPPPPPADGADPVGADRPAHPADGDDPLFGSDYVHFVEPMLGPEQSAGDAGRIVDLLGLAPGRRVLDAPCGHGRIGRLLRGAGIATIGLDRQHAFVRRAAAPAGDGTAAAGAAPPSAPLPAVQGDLRRLPVADASVDAAVCWFNSFGIFDDDDDNRRVLAEFRRVLRASGRLLVDTVHHDGFVRHFSAAPDATVVERGDDLLVDVSSFDPHRGQVEVRRTVARGGKLRHVSYRLRLPTLPEWDRWLAGAGFSSWRFVDHQGDPVELDDWQLVVVATA